MLDWDDLRFFLSIARTGSLSGAARELGVTQPTVGRRLEKAEARLGAKLFQRTPTGFVLTDAGESVLEHAERMNGHALAVEHLVAGRDEGISGQIRLNAPEWLAHRLVAPIVARFAMDHPGVEVDLVAETRWVNLPRRDADLALRLAPFEHHEVIQRALATVPFGLYAAPSYLEKHGTPDLEQGCPGHSVLTMTTEQPGIADLAWIHQVASEARVAARANGREMLASMAEAGGGLACLPSYLGDAIGGLVRIESAEPPSRKLWLGVHRDARDLPRLRAFASCLGEDLAVLDRPPRVRAREPLTA